MHTLILPGVLQCVAVCCSVLRHPGVLPCALQSAVCCSVLRHTIVYIVCCTMLQFGVYYFESYISDVFVFLLFWNGRPVCASVCACVCVCVWLRMAGPV